MEGSSRPLSSTLPSTEAPGRNLSVVGFVVLVVIYLAIIQGGALLLTIGRDVGYSDMSTIDLLWRTLLVPVGASLVLAYAAVAWLGWRRPVWVDDKPVQRWVVVVPVLMAVSILVVIDYGALVTKGFAFSALLLLGTLMVGFAEEGMYRGLGVTVFRRRGFSEGRVALWSTVLFGVSHASNLILEGPSAFAQVVSTIIAGYFFYLIRRRSGGLLLPALLHALWDFSLLSGQVIPGEVYRLSLVAILVMIVLAVVVFARRRHIEPVESDAGGRR